MKILYLYNPANPTETDDTEGHIRWALDQLGHEVVMLPEARIAEAPELSKAADWLLFHKGGPRIHEILPRIACRKACWYFDKVWRERVAWMHRTQELVDLVALSDGDWQADHPSKCVVLRQGIGDAMAYMEGRRTDAFAFDVVFLGSVYGERVAWVEKLRDRYGERFRAMEGWHGPQLADLVASAKVFVAPTFPSTDRYWSNRIYLMLGLGALLVHPELRDLSKEFQGFHHFVPFKADQPDDDIAAIDFALENPAQASFMRLKGREHARAHHKMSHRVGDLVKLLYGKTD